MCELHGTDKSDTQSGKDYHMPCWNKESASYKSDCYVAPEFQCKARAIYLTQSLVIMSTILPAKDCSRHEYGMMA